MSNQVIPDEAVEAAWATVWEVPHLPTSNITREEMRLALEAAAPHLMAAVWDEAVTAAEARRERIEHQLQAPDESVDDSPLVNPYRKART